MSLGPYPDFAWSLSRERTLRSCVRRYFYDTYGQWLGWEHDAPAEARAAYRLKKLTNLDLAVGSSVHRRVFELTTNAQRGHGPPPVDTLVSRSRLELRRLYRTSRESFQADPKSSPMLREFYYGDGPDGATIERVKEKLDRCLHNLQGLDLWNRIMRWEVGVPYVHDPDQYVDPVVDVDGVPVYATPDLVVEENGVHTIVEFKTGKERPSDLDQIHVYGLFLKARLSAAACHGRLVYLLAGSSKAVELTDEGLNECEERIREGIAQMRALVAGPKTNRPRPKAEFPLTSWRWECSTCVYYELCEEELHAEGPLPWE